MAESWNNVGNDPNLREDGNTYIKAGITPVAGGTEMFSNVIYIQPALAAPTGPSEWSGVNPAAKGFITGVDANTITADIFETGNNSRFYLLEAAEDGSNFLVMDDYPGKGGIANSTGRTISMDPSDPNNTLAYWLNNGFLNAPNGDGDNDISATGAACVGSTWRGLPSTMVSHVKRDSVWVTEKATDPSDPQSVYTAAVTLPSFTEITKHVSKLKYLPGAIWLTRSIHNSGANNGAGGMYVLYGYAADGMHLAGHMGNTAAGEGNIRAIFRLNRSYFTSVHIDPAKMGANVKAMLVENYTSAELASVYNDAELTAIGFDVEAGGGDVAPSSNVTITGNFGDVNVPGVTYTVSLDGTPVDRSAYNIRVVL